MHPNPKFHWRDREEMAAFVADIGFGTLIAQCDGALRAVHVPVLVEAGRLRFHVARGNAIHAGLVAGCDALFIVNGPDAYVSPDWYGMPDRVPTWNYVAVELEGPVRALDRGALIGQLDDLSARQEARLAPKPAWTRAKMREGRFEAMLGAITAFEMEVADWRGTIKLGQDKPEEARLRVADALGGHEVAQMMRATCSVPRGGKE